MHFCWAAATLCANCMSHMQNAALQHGLFHDIYRSAAGNKFRLSSSLDLGAVSCSPLEYAHQRARAVGDQTSRPDLRIRPFFFDCSPFGLSENRFPLFGPHGIIRQTLRVNSNPGFISLTPVRLRSRLRGGALSGGARSRLPASPEWRAEGCGRPVRCLGAPNSVPAGRCREARKVGTGFRTSRTASK